MTFTPVSAIDVRLDFGAGAIPVGRLAIRERKIYFEYTADFLARGLDISPLRLPLRPGLQSFDPFLFEGLPGVFNDSLPDGWGRLLTDRALRAQGILPEQISPLDRLALVGANGMGALTFEPDLGPDAHVGAMDLDRLAAQTADVLEGHAEDVLAELIALNGSSAGARPKAMFGYNHATDAIIHGAAQLPDGFEPWLVKFPNSQDGGDAGAIEYVYAQMAAAAGVEMNETRLFATSKGARFFATRRFDRAPGQRLHAHSASGLLHADHRIPALDYEDLLALSGLLTRDIREAEKMFRLAVFNVMAHNRDDHAKNFSYLMNPHGEWRLSPAYDLTFSSGPGGEQTTTIMGEGKAPGLEHLRKLGEAGKLPRAFIDETLARTQGVIALWPETAKAQDVAPANIKLIGERLKTTASL